MWVLGGWVGHVTWPHGYVVAAVEHRYVPWVLGGWVDHVTWQLWSMAGIGGGGGGGGGLNSLGSFFSSRDESAAACLQRVPKPRGREGELQDQWIPYLYRDVTRPKEDPVANAEQEFPFRNEQVSMCSGCKDQP